MIESQTLKIDKHQRTYLLLTTDQETAFQANMAANWLGIENGFLIPPGLNFDQRLCSPVHSKDSLGRQIYI